MRVLVLTERYPPHYLGGYELACHAVAEGLRERGHAVAVVTSRFGVVRASRDGHVHRALHRPQDSPDLTTLGLWEALDHRALRRLTAGFEPDVIYVWCLLSLFPSLHRAVRGLGVPVVTNLQDIWIPTHVALSEEARSAWGKEPRGLLRRAAKRLVRGALRLAVPSFSRPLALNDVDLRHVVFCSRFRQAQHVERGLPLGESRVIYNGIDLRRFSPGPVAPAGGSLRALFIGRLAPEKGLHTLVGALGRLAARGRRNVTLSVVGVPTHPWDYAAGVRQRVEAGGLQDTVRFLDPMPQAALPEVYRRHDVLVFPSIGDEGLPLTLLEGMASGLAVVSTTTGGSAEIVTDGRTALAFAPGDEEGLADRLCRLSDEPELRRALGAAARDEAGTRFGIDPVSSETEGYLAGVVSAG